jgi:hypothetical protein
LRLGCGTTLDRLCEVLIAKACNGNMRPVDYSLIWSADQLAARAGTPCRSAAMPNGRCRMHGGKSTGPRTPEGIERIRASRTKHGRYSQAAIERRREMRQSLRLLRDLLKEVR